MFEKDTSRKYQCFVCNEVFEDYDTFKEHILENHEEGTDYVLCPIAHCQAPVRDVVQHHKAKHPWEILPKKGMLKASIWRDYRGKRKKKVKFKQGHYSSIKMDKSFYYKSGYELTVLECLDNWKQIIAFEVEPFEIPYIHRGNDHKYLPDFLVVFADGRKEVWEIKPDSQTTYKKNIDKWRTAELYCEARGWKFYILTEEEIEKLKRVVINETAQ